MNLKATKTEEIIVDATELQEQIDNLSFRINKIPSYSFDETELTNKIQDLDSKLENYIKFDTSTDKDFDETIGNIQRDIKQLKETDSTDKLLEIQAKLDSYIKFDTTTDSSFKDSIGSIQKEIVALKDQLANYKPEVNVKTSGPVSKFEFVLEKDAEGFSDASWEKIIKEGQKIQYEYWKKAEEVWNKKVRMYEGWHGSAMSPIIKIICEEPEYLFKNTVRLPGRFCLSSNRRWSSVLRFYTFGDKVLKDDTGYGYKWDAPVCIYVEGKTYTKMPDGGTMVMKPFEQTIEEVIICPMIKGIPVYLCENQDRFCMRHTKVLSHG